MSITISIKDWNEKIKSGIEIANSRNKKLREYHNAYRNEEAIDKHENISFSAVLGAIVNTSIRVPTVRVEVGSAKKTNEIAELYRAANRNRLLIDNFSRKNNLRGEVVKCIVDSKTGYWGLLEIVKADNPFGYLLKRRSQFELITEPLKTDHSLEDNDWIALQWIKHKDELARDKSLKNNKTLQGNYNPNSNDRNVIQRMLVEPIVKGKIKGNLYQDQIVGFDIYDKINKKLIKVVHNLDLPLKISDWPIKTDEFPFITLWYYFNPDRQLPVSPMVNIKPIEDEVNDLKAFQLNHARKISRRIILTKKNQFKESVQRTLEESSKDIVAEIKGNPNTDVSVLKENSIGFEFDQAIASAKSGLSSIGHEFIDARKFETAKEPGILNENAQKLSSYEALVVEDFVGVALTKLMKVSQSDSTKRLISLDETEYLRVLKSDKEILVKQFVPIQIVDTFTRENIKLEDIAIKNTGPDKTERPFNVNQQDQTVEIALPFFEVSKDLLKGDFTAIVDRGSMGLESLPLTLGLFDRFKGDPFINQEGLRRIVLDSTENSKIKALLRNEHDVREEINAERKKAVEAEIAQIEAKKNKDLQKTKMQIDSKEKIARESAAVKAMLFIDPVKKREEGDKGEIKIEISDGEKKDGGKK